MDLLYSTMFNGFIFPAQVVACFIHFSPRWAGHMSPIFHHFRPLGIDLPLYSPGEMEQVEQLT